MPYISQHEREFLDLLIERLQCEMGSPISNPGRYNYTISRLLRPMPAWPLSYQLINAIHGILECVKLEFYRRLVGPYEDEKCHMNGDVYGT